MEVRMEAEIGKPLRIIEVEPLRIPVEEPGTEEA